MRPRGLVLRTLRFNYFFSCRHYSSAKACDPLRILFCGSDEFSIASLNALYNERVESPDTIASIDVVCRPGKPVGRAMKTIREVPIKAAANELSLPIHELDTFTKWTPPKPQGEPINLIIAVSFGLFIPPRILKGAKYGGLNVHPSLLPDFRGAAPLHHTLLAGDKTTGVTLQTLDSAKFDHGLILDQTPAPGFPIPDPDSCDLPRLLKLASTMGAEMLINGIRNRLFVPPLNPIIKQTTSDERELRPASKIKPENRHISWSSWSWDAIRRHQIVLGALWSTAATSPTTPGEEHLVQRKRIIFGNMKLADSIRRTDGIPFTKPAVPFTLKDPANKRDEGRLFVFTSDGKLLEIEEMKVEGDRMAPAYRAALKAKLVDPVAARSSMHSAFHGPLL
ncbi:methionyl-tRNA formyltransferase [Trichophyton mentagrophytes]|nr:methionyl-tRNA formyltransferase [Trichophyton mentagrophytes]